VKIGAADDGIEDGELSIRQGRDGPGLDLGTFLARQVTLGQFEDSVFRAL
jgi:hypothetical protein